MSSGSRASGIAPPRFQTAVHILVWLAGAERVCPSSEIALGLQSHSTFLRRVLAPLVQTGLVEAREGRDGGYRLQRPADEITLADVYNAVKTATAQAAEEVAADAAPDATGESGCGPRGEQLDAVLAAILDQAEEQAVEFLDRITIADLARRVEL